MATISMNSFTYFTHTEMKNKKKVSQDLILAFSSCEAKQVIWL